MHHLALDGPGADDRHLDHQVVEVPRLEARQHAHLRAATRSGRRPTVSARQSIVVDRRDRRAARGPRSSARAVVRFDEAEASARSGEHAQAERSILTKPSASQVVLVPLHDRAAGHRRRLDRARPRASGPRDDHHAARRGCRDGAGSPWMLAASRGRASTWCRRRSPPARGRARGCASATARRSGPSMLASIERLRAASTCVEREPERLAHVADRASARGSMMISQAIAGAVAAVACVDVLDDLLAPLVRRCRGRCRASRRAPRERKRSKSRSMPIGIDRGDAEGVADRRVGRRAAPLAEDPRSRQKRTMSQTMRK